MIDATNIVYDDDVISLFFEWWFLSPQFGTFYIIYPKRYDKNHESVKKLKTLKNIYDIKNNYTIYSIMPPQYISDIICDAFENQNKNVFVNYSNREIMAIEKLTIEKLHEIMSAETYYISMHERFDNDELIKHTYNGKCDDIHYINSLINYRKSASKKRNEIHVSYEVHPIGRMKPTHRGKFVFSQQNMWNYTKGYACQSVYDDFDIADCQMSCLTNFLSVNELFDKEREIIEEYQKKREDMFAIIIKRNENVKTRRDAKVVINKLLFSKTKSIQFLMSKIYVLPQTVKNMVNAILNIRAKILKLFPEVVEHAKEVKQKKQQELDNIEGSSFAHFLQTLERIIICHAIDYLKKQKIHVGSIIFDGCHVEKGRLTKRIITNVRNYVYKQTGFGITFVIKKFSKDLDGSYLSFDDEVVGDKRNLFQPLRKYYENDKINKMKISFLTRKNGRGYNFIKEIDVGNGITYLIRSHTGSGKTTFIKMVMQLYAKYDMLSIVSRRSMADIHSKEFDIPNYQDINKNNGYHKMEEVIQIDSLLKIGPELFENSNGYIVILDEIASICDHLLSEDLASMKQNRVLIVKRLQEILMHPNCKLVIGTDADLNDGAVDFIDNLCHNEREVYVYDNIYKIERKTPINHFLYLDSLIQYAVDLLNKGEKVILCSNQNHKFKELVVNEIFRRCEIEEGEYLMYSGNEGETRVDTSKWNLMRLIVATPTIVYGCDSNIGFHVCSFYLESNFWDAKLANQQINRERQPKSINIFAVDHCVPKIYSSPDEVKSENANKLNMSFDINQIQSEYGEDIDLNKYKHYTNCLNDLYYYKLYRQSHHMNFLPYLFKLLRKKGYENIRHITAKVELQETDADTKSWITKKIESMDAGNDEEKLQDDYFNKLEMFGFSHNDSFHNIEGNEEKEELDKFYKTVMGEYRDIFLKNSDFNRLYLWKKFRQLDALDNIDVLDKDNNVIMKDYNLPVLHVKDKLTKLKLLLNIRKKLGVSHGEELDSITNKNYNDEIALDDSFRKLCTTSFKIRKNGGMPKTRLALTQFYMSKMSGLCGVTSGKKKFTYNKKQYEVLKWDDGKINLYNDIISYKQRKSKLRFSVNRFEDDDF